MCQSGSNPCWRRSVPALDPTAIARKLPVGLLSPMAAVFQTAAEPGGSHGFMSPLWAGTNRSSFAVVSLWGKFGGLHACGATFPYIVPLPNIFLTRLFSKLILQMNDFQEILRLPWAQEVPGSNPGAPTKTSRVFSSAYQDPSSPPTSLWNS